MKLYNCMVSMVDMAGLPLTTVPKKMIPAPEVILLQKIHGYDRVAEIDELGEARDVPDAMIRLVLSDRYRPARVEAILGDRHVPLPTEVPPAPDETGREDTDANGDKPAVTFELAGDDGEGAAFAEIEDDDNDNDEE